MKIIPLNTRTLIEITGQDRLEFLQGLITVDIYQLKSEKALWCGLLSPQGKALFDFFIYHSASKVESLFIDIHTTRCDDFINYIKKYILRSDVHIQKNTDLTVTAILDTEKPEIDDAIILVQDPRLNAMGFRLVTSHHKQTEFIDTHKENLSEGDDYKNLRIEYGLVDPAEDMANIDYYWPEINAEQFNGVDYKKGCYVGQEVTARLKHKTELRNKIVSVFVMGNPETPITMATDIQDIGTLLCFDEFTGKGLAYVRTDRWQYAIDTLRSVLAGSAMIMKIA
jgi:tRNA-modifying protein YgfZ